MTEKYRSNIMAAIYETAEDLHEAELLDKRTMREFDELCLTPIRPLIPDEIRNIRQRENVSQSVFANYLLMLRKKFRRGVLRTPAQQNHINGTLAYAGSRSEPLRYVDYHGDCVTSVNLNVSKGIISKWECGEKHPSGASLKLLLPTVEF
jgi:DNA-binding transcriptional regulator YiaG